MTNEELLARGQALAESGAYQPSPTEHEMPNGSDSSADIDIPIAVMGPPSEPDNAVDGAAFVLDQPEGVASLWGRADRVLWPRGEALMIAGGQGLGKTTLAGLLLKGLLGQQPNVLGLPISDIGCHIMYLAMDRPSQIARSLARQFGHEHRDLLKQRVTFWKGPPPRDLAANPALLAKMAAHYDAGVVIVDSLKDAAVRLSEDAVGAQWNRARQHLLSQGCELLELHHSTKRGPAGGPITGVADIYGSTWLTSGCGSIVLLTGEPGDPIVSFRHVKQPAEEVGPYQLLHDESAGHLAIDFQVDLIELVKASGVHGLTAKDAAVAITGKDKPSAADVEKARRLLNKKAEEQLLVRMGGSRGGAGGASKGSTPAAWFLAS
jgi:AAA domain